MKFYIDTNGCYYQGVRILPSDIEVPERPSPLHKWSGTEWVQDDDAVKVDLKARAEKLLKESDWAAMPDVTTLTNKAEWIAYRAALRSIAVNATVGAVIPAKPEEVWQ